MPVAVTLRGSLRKEFHDYLHGKDLKGMEDYGLNSELKEKLKEKYDYYTENTNAFGEKLKELTEVMMKFEEEVQKANDAMNKK